MLGRLFSLLAVSAALCAGCGGGSTVLVSTPKPAGEPSVIAVPSPGDQVVVKPLDAEWTPVMIGGDKGGELSRAIADRESVMMILGKGLEGAAWEDKAFQMVKAASSGTKVVARGRAKLDTLLQERGEIPYRVSMQPAGTDVLGRPYYLPREHPLNTDWLSRKRALKGAEAVLTVRRVRVDDRKLRSLREERRGSCEPLFEAFSDTLRPAGTVIDQFAREVDDRLEKSFSRHLGEALPFWKKEVASLAAVEDPGTRIFGCLEAYGEFLGKYDGCVEKTCGASPRFVPTGGGAIAMDDAPFSMLPDRCVELVGRDYAEEMEALAARSVEDVIGAIRGEWSSNLLKYAAVRRLAGEMEKACSPRHRRFSAADLDRARVAVGAFGGDLARGGYEGEWSPADGQERVPGLGPVRVLARHRATGGDPVAEAARVARDVRGIDRCDEGGEDLLQVSMIDVGTSEVVFMGIFFEEQLFCDELAPGAP